jgi:hypothetical protein
MPKTAIREVLESLNPFKKKKKVSPLTSDPKTVDGEAMGIGGEVITLYRRGAGAGLSLDGKLVERRDAIADLANAKKYAEARKLLAAYRADIDGSISVKEDAALYADLPGMTDEEREHARQLRLSIAEDVDSLKLDEAADAVEQLGEVCAGAQMRADLGLDRVAEILRGEIDVTLPEGTLPKEKKEIETLQAQALKALDGKLTADKIEQARKLARPVFSAVDAIERRLEVTEADPTALYERLKLRVNDIVNYPAEYRSAAIRKATHAVENAQRDAQLRLADFTRAAKGSAPDTAAKAATAAVSLLRQKIDAAAPALRAHDEQVRKYFASLKKMTPQIQVADTLPEVDNGTETAWKAERQAYDVSRQAVVTLQNEGKFREANVELAKCAGLMKALLDKRRAGIDTDIGGAGNPTQAKQLVADLKAKGLLKILTAKQQLALVGKLPSNTANKPARFDVFANPAMDEDFVKEEQKVLKDVVKLLRGDDGKNATPESRRAKQEWEDNEKNWKAWAGKDPKQPGATDIPKLKGIFQKIAELQFEKLMALSGLDPKHPPVGFPSPPVTVKLEALPDDDDFGETTPNFPAEIIINSNHAMFGDFKEMMDTILHENAHAWQNMIVAQYKGTGPFTAEHQAKVKGGTALPAMKVQAALFAENDASYTNTGEAYRHEPLEEQAWTFGGKSAQALLVPPPKRSFDSSKGLRNKFWFVGSMSRTASARIRLNERHGIYVAEWEGEKAKDKKLTLEGVPGVSPATRLVVEDVIDEYTLELDLDASGLRGRMVSKTELQQEMAALAKTAYPDKTFDKLSKSERKAVFDAVLLQEDWEASGSEDDQTAVVRAKDEVDVEHGRLVLDESVAKLV